MKETKDAEAKKTHKFSRTVKAALMERRKESGRQKERREARWRKNISSLLKRLGWRRRERAEAAFFFLSLPCPPEKSAGNMLQRKNILLTAS